MSALAKRGLPLEQARANMRWLVNAHGGMKEAAAKLGVPLSTFNSALNGKWGPGEKVLTAMYGPDGSIMLDHLVPARMSLAVAASPFRPAARHTDGIGDPEPDDDGKKAEAGEPRGGGDSSDGSHVGR